VAIGGLAACGPGPDPNPTAGSAEALAYGGVTDPGPAGIETEGAAGEPTPRHHPRGRAEPEPSPPVPHGTVDEPFAPLPPSGEARAVVSPTGVVMPVIDERRSSWLVSTACEGIRFVARDEAEPVGRAHVVLDPGHGGAEVGAVGETGLTEKDLNLRVARRAAEILRGAGATVVLTRDGDHTVTAGTRGLIADAVEPALLVSIHHNGGAPAGPGGPGTIVFTKSGSRESTRFGGLLHQALQPMLTGAAAAVRERHAAWMATVDEYDAAVAAHRASVAARDEALVANGQLPPGATTTPPPPTTVAPGGLRIARPVESVTTTTLPATAPTTVPVPDTIPPPPVPDGEPVAEFRWAGSGNAGVRSWVRADGRDRLAVLRRSGSVPAVLAEFLYVTNPAEESLLLDEGFVDKEAGVLADAIILFFTGNPGGTGFVADQHDDQPIGDSGGIDDCVEPSLE
jgi:N-acetylmuramoyl-L-alanine amidase